MRIPYTLEIIVFVCGAVVMILELVGSRILAPYVGTSMYVWTSLIGVILASLSTGYWLGGKLADKNPQYHLLSSIIAGSALLVGITAYINQVVLNFITNVFIDIRVAAVLAALVLYAPSSTLLGMVSPFAARLKMKDVTNSGTTIGNLYALSTIGSIVGTFISGFFLISFLGSTNIQFLLAGILLLTALFLGVRENLGKYVGIGFFLLYVTVGYTVWKQSSEGKRITDVDTTYDRVWIFDLIDQSTHKPIRVMSINNTDSSAAFLDSDELVFEYTKFYRLAEVFNPHFSKTLMIGGAAYSYPKYYLKQYPEAGMDVVEIDPGVTSLAKKHFNLQPNEKLNIIHEDGRTLLNQTGKKYDVILGDAFKTYSVPFQLTTIEAVQRIYNGLTPNGVAIINLVGSIEGDTGKFVRAEYKTYGQVFPHVYLFPVNYPEDGSKIQNVMLVALKNPSDNGTWRTEDPALKAFLSLRWNKAIPSDIPVLTDDFAPVDYYNRLLL